MKTGKNVNIKKYMKLRTHLKEDGFSAEFLTRPLKHFLRQNPMCDTLLPGNNSEVFNMAASVKLDNDLKNRIQQLADIRHRSSHWIMCEAIRDYVECEEAREKFKQEALISWKSSQPGGA